MCISVSKRIKFRAIEFEYYQYFCIIYIYIYSGLVLCFVGGEGCPVLLARTDHCVVSLTIDVTAEKNRKEIKAKRNWPSLGMQVRQIMNLVKEWDLN